MGFIAVFIVALAFACTAPSAAPAQEEPIAQAAPPEPHTAIVGALGGIIKTGWTPDWSGEAGVSRGCMRSYAAGRYALELPLEAGDRLLSMSVVAIGNFDADLEVWSVRAVDGKLQPPTVVLTVSNVLGDQPTDFGIDLADTVITDRDSHWIEFATDAGGLCVGAVRLTYDHPSA